VCDIYRAKVAIDPVCAATNRCDLSALYGGGTALTPPFLLRVKCRAQRLQ
jgi:hypothetical protein